jgi:hypothetical protein
MSELTTTLTATANTATTGAIYSMHHLAQTSGALLSHVSEQHDPRPDLATDSHLWEIVLSALVGNIEPYSILKSLRFAGAYINADRIVWRHLDLVMPEEEILEEFLMPYAEPIRGALGQLEHLQAA